MTKTLTKNEKNEFKKQFGKDADEFVDTVNRIRGDEDFKKKLEKDPNAALRELGIDVPPPGQLRKQLKDLPGAPAETMTDEQWLAASQQAMDEAMKQAAVPTTIPAPVAVTRGLTEGFPRGIPGLHPGAFWWGFQLPLSHADVDDVKSFGVDLAKLALLLAGVMTASVVGIAIAGFSLAICVYLAIHAGVIGAVQGTCRDCRGLWISMSWFAIGSFIPSCAA